MELETVLVAAVGLGCALLAAVHLLRRRRRQRRTAAAMAAAAGRGMHVPLTLHPVIDRDICIGSLSCLKSCPEGDILGVVNGAARLVHADHCIGHGRCAAECPVDAIRLVFGSSERGVDLPMVDEFFESSRAGVHIIGELGGMGLIRNAVSQGLQVAERLAEVTPGQEGSPTDVVIVGAGPAGLATALRLREAGRSFRAFEQETLGGTIANYPRQKVVMTEGVHAPSSEGWRRSASARRTCSPAGSAHWRRRTSPSRRESRSPASRGATARSGCRPAAARSRRARWCSPRAPRHATHPGRPRRGSPQGHLSPAGRGAVRRVRRPGGGRRRRRDRSGRPACRAERRPPPRARLLSADRTAHPRLAGRAGLVLPSALRRGSSRLPVHEALRPAGRWGHGIGIVATAFMLLNFLYPVRKRSRILAGKGSIRSWLDFHIFVGFMGPLVIAFHAAFQSNNQLATGTATAPLIVVLTGIVGRVHLRAGPLRRRQGDGDRGSDGPVGAAAGPPPADAGGLGRPRPAAPAVRFRRAARATRIAAQDARHAAGVRRPHPPAPGARPAALPRPAGVRELEKGYLLLSRLRVQVTLYQSLKNLLHRWRLFHATLAGFLVIAIAAHIAVSIYLGCVWFR